MKAHKYCFHVTDGMNRAALICGTVTASSMEEAATIAAKRCGLSVVTPEPDALDPRPYWAKNGARRSVYVMHDPTT